ncbi:MAG TPA: zinc finger domain-containing protein [Candidatus Bathyarchaeia archaeon]|nr:zinc finger domain-containing protein [Candidatus Bathyarchaeia archaeon]
MAEVRTVKMPSCNWCGRMILPREGAVHFPCPQCGEVTIWRCEKCRGFGRSYKCQKCGFTGP